MLDVVEEAVAAIHALPTERREELARLVLRIAKADDAPEDIDPAHLPAVLEGLEEAERREFASEDEVAAVFRSFDR